MIIPDEVRREIREELSRIEASHECRVLLAVESGSRAWGFPSHESDYDVRFVYAHRPEWYLSIDVELRRDVVERPITDHLDVSGWDLRKSLRLFAKSNPPLLEWLSSPVVYGESCDFAAELRALLEVHYSPARSVYHYLHMARRNYRDYLKGDVVWRKKYLYALRPLLAVRWIEQGRGVVPMEFARLLETVGDRPELAGDVSALVERKVAGDDLGRGPAIASIGRFIADELARYERFTPPDSPREEDLEVLNELFRRILRRAWGPE